MPASHPTVTRRLLHRRALDVQVFARDDGLFDVEASLADTKTHDVPLAGTPRKAGDPIHQMRLLLTVDAELNITSATSQTLWMPYPGACDAHGDAYVRLVGLNLMKGFRQAVNERLSGTRGCTHLTELCQVLPTAVIQAMAGSVIDTRERPHAHATAAQPPERAESPSGGPSPSREGDPAGPPPFQLDRCHALRRDGATVAKFYPRWHLKAASEPAATAS
jgi:hypothetical protein